MAELAFRRELLQPRDELLLAPQDVFGRIAFDEEELRADLEPGQSADARLLLQERRRAVRKRADIVVALEVQPPRREHDEEGEREHETRARAHARAPGVDEARDRRRDA